MYLSPLLSNAEFKYKSDLSGVTTFERMLSSSSLFKSHPKVFDLFRFGISPLFNVLERLNVFKRELILPLSRGSIPRHSIFLICSLGEKNILNSNRRNTL